jgi:hypothetical protein
MAMRARSSLERWADEDEARGTGPAVAATAIAMTALARIDGAREAAGHGGMALQVAALRVSDRVAALLEDRPTQRAVPAAVIVVAAVALAAVLWAAHDMEHAFEVLQALAR